MFAKVGTYFVLFLFAFLFLTATVIPAFSALYTLDARDDAGTAFGQPAYAQFAGSDGNIYPINLPDAPTTATDIYNAAPPNLGWTVQAAGNIWSTDKVVGDSYSFPAGTYRIDAASGGFTYDSFGWSNVSMEPLQWVMNIRAMEGSGTYTDTTLGVYLAKDVGTLPLYIYVTLKTPGSLGFWITDGNSIDNSGSLTFAITSVPAPPSLFLLAGGLPFLLPRVRRFLARL